MNIKLLKGQDTKALDEYLAPHKAECMFICSNLSVAGIEYKGATFEGEYFGCFENQKGTTERLVGIIVHYWNGNIMMHASHHTILKKLVEYLKKNIKRPVEGVLGPNTQAELVIRNLGIPNNHFSINSNEGLYAISLTDFNEPHMPCKFNVVAAQDAPKSVLIEWMKSYYIEALGSHQNDDLEKKAVEHWDVQLEKKNSWVLLADGIPVSLSAFNARLTDMVQIGPVWTPPEHRNKGFARLLLAHTLQQEKHHGINQAILFTNNPAAIKAYLAIGFRKIGDYRLAILEKSVMLQG